MHSRFFPKEIPVILPEGDGLIYAQTVVRAVQDGYFIPTTMAWVFALTKAASPNLTGVDAIWRKHVFSKMPTILVQCAIVVLDWDNRVRPDYIETG